MALSKALAVKLLRLAEGEFLPASTLKYPLVSELVSEGIIVDNRRGRTKSSFYVPTPVRLQGFILNRFGIADLRAYTTLLATEELSRAALIRQASDSKARRVKVFKGFLVNSYEPINAMLDGNEIIINPPTGTFQFIHNYERFVPDAHTVIVNVENSENFSSIAKQRYLFSGLSPLFVSRYPQNGNGDMLSWLLGISNSYLHFGDFDFAGINIYLNEYKRFLGSRAKFFVPDNLEDLIKAYGNSDLYDRQKAISAITDIDQQEILQLVELLHRYKKGLEQEVLIPV